MNKLRCAVEWGSYWWYLRLSMLNYTHECLNDMSGTALLTVPLSQTAVHRSWTKITTSYVSNVGQDWFPGYGVHYITELCLIKLRNFDLHKAPTWSMPIGGAAAFLIALQREREMEKMRLAWPPQQVSVSVYLKWCFYSRLLVSKKAICEHSLSFFFFSK